MHKISFKATLPDRLEEFQAGLKYASVPRRIARYGALLLLLIGFLLYLCSLLLMWYHQHHPTNWPLILWPPRQFSLMMGGFVGVLPSAIVGAFVGVFLPANIAWDNPREVRLFPEHIVLKRRFSGNVIGWQDVTALSSAGSYLHLWFCQDSPNVIVVPKSAFSSLIGAEAFYTVMLEYWQDATGRLPPVPETAGVWPPAPQAGNSVEPGDNRKRY